MQISFAPPAALGPGTLVVSVYDGGVLTPQAARYDEASGGALKRAVEASRFKGQPGRSIEVLAPNGLKPARVVLVGVGKGEKFDSAAAERLAASIAGRLLARETDDGAATDGNQNGGPCRDLRQAWWDAPALPARGVVVSRYQEDDLVGSWLILVSC